MDHISAQLVLLSLLFVVLLPHSLFFSSVLKLGSISEVASEGQLTGDHQWERICLWICWTLSWRMLFHIPLKRTNIFWNKHFVIGMAIQIISLNLFQKKQKTVSFKMNAMQLYSVHDVKLAKLNSHRCPAGRLATATVLGMAVQCPGLVCLVPVFRYCILCNICGFVEFLYPMYTL